MYGHRPYGHTPYVSTRPQIRSTRKRCDGVCLSITMHGPNPKLILLSPSTIHFYSRQRYSYSYEVQYYRCMLFTIPALRRVHCSTILVNKAKVPKTSRILYVWYLVLQCFFTRNNTNYLISTQATSI